MNRLRAQIKRDKNGRWTAEIPAISGAISHGATRKEAAAKVAARVLRIAANRIEEGDLPEMPETILVGEASHLYNLLFEGGNIPNAETIAAIEELEKGGGKSFGSVEELMAELNADD